MEFSLYFVGVKKDSQIVCLVAGPFVNYDYALLSKDSLTKLIEFQRCNLEVVETVLPFKPI